MAKGGCQGVRGGEGVLGGCEGVLEGVWGCVISVDKSKNDQKRCVNLQNQSRRSEEGAKLRKVVVTEGGNNGNSGW